jgi:hypothetical protein
MPADPEEAPSYTGVAGESSSFPSPSFSTDVPAGLNTDTDALANQGQLPSRPHDYIHVIILVWLSVGAETPGSRYHGWCYREEAREKVTHPAEARGVRCLQCCFRS